MNLIELLKSKNLYLATAESLTGGLVAAGICNITGASQAFKGGIITYTKKAKCELLGLNQNDIDTYGVYSEETAIAMAKGVKAELGVEAAIATTGVAGPNCDESVDPGTVYFSFIIGDKVFSECKFFSGDRNSIRALAASYAIDKMTEILSEM